MHVTAHPLCRGKLCALDVFAGSNLNNFLQSNIIAVVEHVELFLCGKLYKCVITCNVISHLLLR